MIGITNVAHSKETSSSSQYLEQVSVASVAALCSDSWFLGHTGLNKKECIESLTDFSEECSRIIRPIIPSMYEGNNQTEIIKFKSIGELYVMCLKANVFNRWGPNQQ